jgi:hypothetical protein
MVAIKFHFERQMQRVCAQILYARGRLIFGDACPTLFEVLSVSPERIVGQMSAIPHKAVGHGYSVVFAGSWDLELAETDFQTDPVYRSCHMRWVHGADWEETPVYENYLNRIRQNKPSHPKAQNEDSLRARYRELDAVYDSVVSTGAMSASAQHLVRVNVARDGRLFWGPDGRHRVAVARIAGLDAIPARAGYVHPDAIEQFQGLRLPRTVR